jgi:hypothetical protein
MASQVLVADAVQHDAHPSLYPHVGRAEVDVRKSGNQHFLNPLLRRYPHGHALRAVVVVVEHREHPLAGEEGGFPVGELLPHPRQGRAQAPHALELPG